MQPGGTPLSGARYLDRLADAIVSLEYYIETLQAGRSDPWYMLDNAQACLEVLQREPEQVVPTVPAISPGNYARTVRISPPPQALAADPTGVAALAPGSLAAARAGRAPRCTLTDRTPDPELTRLFVEEATEEVEKIHRLLPMWDHNPLDSDALLSVRRSFHTLKGSGRMVNARASSASSPGRSRICSIGCSTARCSARPSVLETLRDAVSCCRSWSRSSPKNGGSHRIRQLVARAHACASGREPTVRRRPAASAAVPRPGGAQPGERAPSRRARPQAVGARSRGRCHRGRRPCAARARIRRCARSTRVKPRPTWPKCGTWIARERARARAARAARGGLSRLSHALRQLDHGRGAPRHASGRAARSLAAQILRQRRRTERLGSAAAGRLHDVRWRRWRASR